MELILTEDGSHSIYLKELNETYHSRHGAIQESRHVFLKNGLMHYVQSTQKKYIHIFEIGLGSGLNVLLTSIEAKKLKYFIHYTAIEPFPIPPSIYNQLNYHSILMNDNSGKTLKTMHEAKTDIEIQVNEFFILHKKHKSFEECDTIEKRYDIIYYDAFAPNKQPAIWEVNLLAKAYDMLMLNGMLVTYCSQGNFKRNLRNLGFRVETLKGPPGKKEMVRAIK